MNEKGEEVKYWPRKNLTKLQCDPNSEPITSGPDKWYVIDDTIKRRDIPSVEECNKELERMEYNLTESENEMLQRDTRSTKPKSAKSSNNAIPQFHVNALMNNNALNSAISTNRTNIAPSPIAETDSLDGISSVQSTPTAIRNVTPKVLFSAKNVAIQSPGSIKQSPMIPPAIENMESDAMRMMQNNNAEVNGTSNENGAEALGNYGLIYAQSDGVSVHIL